MISQHLAKQDISDDVTFLNNVIPSGFKDSKTRSVRSRLWRYEGTARRREDIALSC